jgi:hypothetical protein
VTRHTPFPCSLFRLETCYEQTDISLLFLLRRALTCQGFYLISSREKFHRTSPPDTQSYSDDLDSNLTMEIYNVNSPNSPCIVPVLAPSMFPRSPSNAFSSVLSPRPRLARIRPYALPNPTLGIASSSTRPSSISGRLTEGHRPCM